MGVKDQLLSVSASVMMSLSGMCTKVDARSVWSQQLVLLLFV